MEDSAAPLPGCRQAGAGQAVRNAVSGGGWAAKEALPDTASRASQRQEQPAPSISAHHTRSSGSSRLRCMHRSILPTLSQ